MPRQVELLKKNHERFMREAGLGAAADVKYLQEAFAAMADAILKMEDEGWLKFTELQGENSKTKGFTIKEIIKITEYAEKQTKANNLLGRGFRMRTNYVFGRGFEYVRVGGEKIQNRFQAIIDDPENQETVFSETALKELNRVLYTSGNLLVIVNQKTSKISRLTVTSQLSNYVTYEDDPTRVKYWRRVYYIQDDLTTPGAPPREVVEWIPVWQYKDSLKRAKRKLPQVIAVGGGKTEPINQDSVIVDLRVNKDDGEIMGAPDCLSALPWAWAATEYLKDGSKLIKALATIAYHVKAKTVAAAERAGAKLQASKVGSAAITGPDTEISQMPRVGSVDLYEGRPLQAAVASALDVSVAALTADTARGGSYASETALSQPEQLSAISRQKDFADFFHRLFQALGATDLRINFARVDVDPIHRRLQSMGIARTFGGINQQEFRDASLELLDITPTTTALPEPDEFTGSKYSTLPEVIDAGIELQKDQQAADDALARQGNTGAVGSLDDAGNDARNSDRDGATN